MNIDEDLRGRLTAIFRPLEYIAARSFPPAGTMSDSLLDIIPRPKTTSRVVDQRLAACFGSAAVEIWLRAVHSFLISVSLTDESQIWASVTGYYASHYAVRGIAHLLGFYYFFKGREIIRLIPASSGGYTCTIVQKPSGVNRGGEHQLYWSLVKQHPSFSADPLFTDNKQETDESDAGHRNFANYIDHICKYPTFHPLDEKMIKSRIDQISKMTPEATPIPRRSKFPDVGFVQLVAYRRIIAFRNIVDEVLGGKNRFWSVHRNPNFAMEYVKFQLVESPDKSLPVS